MDFRLEKPRTTADLDCVGSLLRTREAAVIRSGVGRASATLGTVGVVLALWPAETAHAAPALLSLTAKAVPFNGTAPTG
jgi:hypothetical protein